MRTPFSLLLVWAILGASGAIGQTAPFPLHKSAASSPKVAITAEQRQRLTEKLVLIDQIVHSVERDLAEADPAANSRHWLLESLLPLSVEQIRAVGMPGTLAATSDAVLKIQQR